MLSQKYPELGASSTAGERHVPLSALLLPTSRSSRGMQITVSELHAENLHAMDFGGSADPYIVAYSTDIFAQTERGHRPSQGAARTKVQFASLQCVWDDILLIRCPGNVSAPNDLLDKSLTLSLWDFDTFSMDDHMGEVVLSLEGIVRAYLESTALFIDKFQGNSERPISQFDGEREDSEGNESPSNKPKNITYQQSFSNGRTVSIGAKEYAFCLPIIRSGEEAGKLSGKIKLHGPDEKIMSSRLKSIGLNWKCTAYLEHRTRKRHIRYPTSQQQTETGDDQSE
jgi:C2 domain